MKIRNIKISDIKKIYETQIKSYPDILHEDVKVLREKIIKGKNYSFIAIDDGEVIGYLIAYKNYRYNEPKFNTTQQREGSKENLNTLFIHDICVVSEHRKKGLGRTLLESSIKEAKKYGLRYINAISVNNSINFAKKMGLIETEIKVESYPPPAYFMEMIV